MPKITVSSVIAKYSPRRINIGHAAQWRQLPHRQPARAWRQAWSVHHAAARRANRAAIPADSNAARGCGACAGLSGRPPQMEERLGRQGFAKGGLLQSRLPPFAKQKTAFCNAKDRL